MLTNRVQSAPVSRRSLFSFLSPADAPTESAVISENEQRAHVLRRLTMTVHPNILAQSKNQSPQELAHSIINDGYNTKPGPVSLIDPAEGNPDDFVNWWLEKLWAPEATLRDRMTWFWHTHMPSSFEKSELVHVAAQHQLLETHALGNFRDLLQALTVDAAMLQYLDGSYSAGDDPNENFAREVMELFALGVGNYTEDDIRVAARGLSGWRVEYDTKAVAFDRDAHYNRPLRFFGARKRWTNQMIIDTICDQPACARHVAGAIYQHLVGGEPSDSTLDELADTFRSNDLEIRPLLEAIVDHPDFLAGSRNRAKSAVEYLVGIVAVLGLDSITPEPWALWALGQVPYQPPNVAGWPGDDRWLNASQVLGRSQLLFQSEVSERLISLVEPEVDVVLQHCGLFDVGDATRAAMQQAADEFPFEQTLELLLGIALTSPEFQLA